LPGPALVTGTPPNQYTLKPADIWLNTSDNNKMMVWSGSAWVDGSDSRIGAAGAGINTEQNARVSSDKVLASAVNTVWGFLGDNQALVQEGSTITVGPSSGQATKYLAVQSETLDTSVTPPKKLVSALRQDFTAETNLQAQRANAAYSLKVEAGVGGVKAIAGMSLTAEVLNGQARTACIFVVDQFGIYSPNLPYAWAAPFLVNADGQVRINVARIGDFIQSDTFIPPNINNLDGVGWKIDRVGNAQFYGTTTLGRVLSGSRMVDRNSGYDMATTAVGAWSGAASGATQHTNGVLRFYGPDWHGYTDLYHRVRSSDGGINLATVVQWMGVADNKLALWWRKNDGVWNVLNSTITPSDGYNAATVGWAGTFSMARGEYIDFGVSPTGYTIGDNNGQVDLKDFTMTVTMSNM